MFKFQVTAEDYAAKYGDSIISETMRNDKPRIVKMLAYELVDEIKERIAIAGKDAPIDHTSRAIDTVAAKWRKTASLINQQANAKGYPEVLYPEAFKDLLKAAYPDTLGLYVCGV